MAVKTYISVILPLKLEWESCYALPEGPEGAQEGLEGAQEGLEGVTGSEKEAHECSPAGEIVQAGDRVKVVFAGKEYTGVVSGVGIEPQTEASKIREIVSVERCLERIREEEIALWRRVAEYYMCSVGEVYKAAYPARKIHLEEARAAAVQKALDKHERMLNSMREKVARLKTKLEDKKTALENAKPGTKKKEQLEGMVERLTNEVCMAESALANAQTTGQAGPDGQTEHPDLTGQTQSEPDITLTPAQEEAYTKTSESLKANKPVMLHGVTGSGKTEIYLRLAADAIRKGKNVLYLVPEIALSKQLTDRLHEHFGDRLLTYHSGETEARRRTIAEKIRTEGKSTPITREKTGQNTEGKAGYIVLGTRSSLFLPHNNLGLIIVDEEHDSSYKQDSPAPRYNGRDTALMLSVIHRCGIVLGSATPSLEEMYNCECGRHTLVTLTERYHGDSETEIEIIDTKAERRKRGMEGSFSRKLIEHIRKTLSEGGQVMILRSRRAWASAMQCEECGEIQKCPHCNVSLSLHKTGDTGFYTCHHCGHKEEYRTTCSKCNGTIKPLGSGTQKIEEEAAALFPDARIARLDSDTAQNRNYETKVIKEFAQGDIDILIGTQILTKGFDFSNLRLTAVIAADTMLGIQDFRADEKAMQLLEQFKGRCGRRGSKGLFIIQTSQPEHPIYQRIAEGETKTFSDSLMAERKTFGFPPYSRIVELTIRDKSQKRAELMVSRLAAALRQIFRSPSGQGLLAASPVTGPYSPVVDKVNEEHIRCIRVSMRKDRTLSANKAVLNETISKFEKDQKYNGYITVNVDPA
ncbi:MAG: primosomal protein N' [Bacteroidales bacterium]|nr:primosomal protein N' [Bacteroidales bacterium]